VGAQGIPVLGGRVVDTIPTGFVPPTLDDREDHGEVTDEDRNEGFADRPFS
jgi:hypothetical protein